MRCPYRAWDRERGRWSGIGDTIEAPYRERGRRPVSETRSRHRIGSAVGGRYRRHDRGAVSGTRSAAGIGDTIEAPYRERRRRPVSETRSRHRIGNAVGGRYRKRRRPICPEWGNAYQPRASPWELHPRESVCSEGTPHRESRGRRDENRKRKAKREKQKAESGKRKWLVSHCQFSEFQLS